MKMERARKPEISLVLTAFFVSLVLSPSLCLAQTSWTKFAGNPVLDSGSGFRHLYQPSVIKENGIYKMWHAVDNPPDGIYYATSQDGITWTHHPANPVLPITSIPWASHRVGEPTVVRVGGIYRMWFDGLTSGQPSTIGYAISPDGINWALSGNDPVLVATQSWETGSGGVGEPEVVHHDGLFRMWYSHAQFPDPLEDDTVALGYADSTDGINWTKFPGNPVLGGAQTPTVVEDGTVYHMWFLDHDAHLMPVDFPVSKSTRSIGYASSPDGINWMRFPGNPVITVQTPVRTWELDQVAWADVVLDESLLEMWFTARDRGQRYGIGYATSHLTTTTSGCGTRPPATLPIPTNLLNPANGFFGRPFTLSWDPVWTGCGGYEVQYKGDATVSIETASGNTVQTTIPLPPEAVKNPTSYALRARSFWGSGNDTKQFSAWSAAGNIEMFLPPPRAIVFPQLALGGGFEVVLFLSNKTTDNWMGTVQLWEGNGEEWSTAWSLDGKSIASSSAFDVTLASRATQKFLLDGDAVSRVGYLGIIPNDRSSEADISVAFFFNFFARFDLTDSIGVAPSLPGTDFTFPVEKTEQVDTGVAYVARSPFPFQIVLTLFDASGNKVRQRVVTYAGHTALFFSEVFQDVPAGFIGEVQVESKEEISLIVIRLQSTSDGFQLTTLPVITVSDEPGADTSSVSGGIVEH